MATNNAEKIASPTTNNGNTASQSKFLDLTKNPLFWLGVQGTCSVCLTLFNKKVANAFPHPIIFIAIQNLASAVLFIVFNYLQILPMNPIRLSHMIQFIPSTLMFVFMLWSSLEGLAAVSVTLVVIARNFVPLVTGVVESVFFDLRLSMDGYVSLALVGIGSVLYALTDGTINFKGLQWLALNTILVVAIPMVEKQLMAKINKEQTPTGVTFVRNMVSVPLLLIMAFVLEGFTIPIGKIWTDLTNLSAENMLFMILTCIFGFAIGVAYFFLLKLISNTSLAIANTSYKLITLAASLLMWGVPFAAHGWIGVAMSFTGISWYTYLKQVGLLEQKGDVLPNSSTPQSANFMSDFFSPKNKLRLYIIVGSSVGLVIWMIGNTLKSTSNVSA